MAQAREYIPARRQTDSHLDKMGKIPCSMPLSAVDKSDKFACLKQKIAAEQGQETGYLATNIPCFDQALSGGLAYQHIHLITTAYGDAAATGFILALLRAQIQQRPNAPIIWCSPRFSSQYGHLCAEGMLAMGINPGQIIFIHDPHPARLLSAFEEALQTTGIAGVVAEYGLLAEKSDQWLRWAQRLRRAARAGDNLGFLLGPPAPSTGFETSWSVASLSAQKACLQSQKDYLKDWQQNWQQDWQQDWRPRWSARLTKSRKGYLAEADIYYCPISGQLSLLNDIAAEPPGQASFALSAAASGADFEADFKDGGQPVSCLSSDLSSCAS
ncbi:MAG: hypothetical protein ACPHDR_00535 [Candidatus Puniceispirillaceae bacterium]